MAIRAGSGSLKYPLLNQAQIVAQQSAAAASSGGSASASAYGANRAFAANKMRVQADLANSAAERQFRDYEGGLNRQFQDYQAEQQRNYGAIQNQTQLNAYADRQQAGFEQQTALQQGYQQFTAGQTQKAQESVQGQNQDQFDLNTGGIEAQVQAGRMTLPPAAQDKLNKLEADRVRAQELDNGQLAEFEAQYRAQKAGLLQLAKPTQSRQEAFDQSLVTHDGQQGQLDEKGNFKPIENPQKQKADEAAAKTKEKAAADQQKQQQAQQTANTKQFHDLMGQVDKETGKPLYTRQQALDQIDFANKAYSPEPVAPAPGLTAPAGSQPGITTGPQPPVPQPPPDAGPTEPLLPNGQRMTQQAAPHTPQGPAAVQKPDGSYGAAPAPLPAGVPQGSKMIDSNTVQLPDGTIIRRKGA